MEAMIFPAFGDRMTSLERRGDFFFHLPGDRSWFSFPNIGFVPQKVGFFGLSLKGDFRVG